MADGLNWLLQDTEVDLSVPFGVLQSNTMQVTCPSGNSLCACNESLDFGAVD